MFLTLTVTTNAWGADVTFDTSAYNGKGGASGTGGSATSTSSGVTITSTKAYYTSAHIREYSGGTITVSSSNNITKIVFTSTASDENSNGPSKISLNSGGGNYSYSGTAGTWTGSSTSIKFDCDAQFRWTKIVVTTKDADPYTVTFHTTATTVEEKEEASAGEGVNPPTMEKECGDWTFQGWSESPSNSETSTTPLSLVTLTNEKYYPTEDIDLYPVYTKSEGGGGTVTWDKITTAPTDWSGEYLIVNSNYAMTSDFNSGTSGEFKGAQVTISNNQVTSSLTDKMIWIVEKNGSNAQYSFKNKSTGTYAKITGTSSTNAALSSSVIWFTISSSSTSGVWKINSVDYSARCFSYYSSNKTFRTYANSSNTTGSLYKKNGSSSTTYYYSYPQCTTETAITLHANDGTNDKTYITTGEKTYTVPLCTFTRTGYDFVKWNTQEDGKGTDYAVGSTINLDGTAVNLYAIWTPQTYDITYKDQGDVAFSGTHDGGYPTKHTYGTATTLKTATKTGYTFCGWYKESDCSGTVVTTLGATEYTDEITLYAKWEVAVITYTITCSVNEETTSKTYEQGATIEFPAVTPCDGMVHVGWTETERYANETTAPSDLLTAATAIKTTTYYAVFAKLVEDSNAPYQLVEADRADWSGKYLIAYSNSVFADGKLGGKTDEGSIGKTGHYVDLSSHIDGNNIPALNGDRIYVKLVPCEGGGYLLQTQDGKYNYYSKNTDNGLNANTDRKVAEPYKLNIVFKQSNDIQLALSGNAKGSVFHHNPSNKIFQFYKDASMSPVYLYRQNEVYTDYSTRCKYTVTFDANGHGEAPESQVVYKNEFAEEPANDPQTAGYNFQGWYENQQCTGDAYDFATPINDDITLYAKWTPCVYTITYKDQGNATFSGSHESGNPTQHTYGTATTLKGATKTGYTFGGWYKEAACTNKVTSLGATEYTANITLYAKWTVNSYTVTWDPNGGNWGSSAENKVDTYEYGAAITKPTDPTLEGYRFDGWGDVAGTMPANNLEYTAQWTKVYTITWNENGVPSYTYVPSDNAVVTWEDNIADCGEKKFYGWTADGTFVSDPTTPPTLISKGTTIAGDVTYYAVYADAEEPANPGYTKVTTISEGTYLIATDNTANKAYTGRSGTNTYGGYCTVEIVDDVISDSKSALEVEITLNGSNFYMHDGTYYLGYTSGNAMTFDASIQTGNQNRWKLTADGYIESVNVTGRILQYNSGSPRFACYSSDQKKAYLYKKQTTTYANFAVSCATYTITVEPDDGTVTTTPADEAGQGQTITVNITPADCKYLTALKYNDGSDHSINIASTPYTFTMPAADVTVTATFADKTATNIEVVTSTHRMLMQGSSFVGEQVRITYNNGDTETLNWNDSRLTFSGYNTANLGSQTVTVTFNGCGTQTTSYNIEVIDGLGITFWDGDYTETIKYEPGDLVDVDSRIGQNICSGWEFTGWSETKVANESNGFTPVHNINATEPRTLYAVYVQTSTDWISAYNIDELHPGAKYVIVAHYSDGKEFALTNTNNTSSSYLDGANLTTDCEKVREGDAYPYKDRYKLKVTPQPSWKWQLVNTGSGWTMRNISANKYLKINSDKTISLTATPDDKFTLDNGFNDSEITAQSSSNNYLSWYNSSKYWNGHTSGQQYYLTNETNFTSTPPCSRLSATFHGNGGIVTDGERSLEDLPITEPTRDAGITTPTASFADCNGKSWTFVGWAREEIDVTRVPVLTTDLLHDGGGNKHYYIQEDGEEFWAVFTNTGDPETKYGTITFTDDDVTRQYENAKTITKSVTAMGDYDFELYHVSNASSLGIQFDHNNATKGYIKNITSLGKINSISLNDFQTGDIDDVKVYVGNMPNAINTLLTEADLQQTGNTYTYYPQKNYAYVKIEANGYCGITSISIDFGKGTQIWATTPDCSTITLSGNEIYVTATNGRAVMAPTTLTVKANQLEANADVILTSNSSDVYFSTDRTFNFAAGQAADQKPTTSLTLPTDAEGNLATTDVYIHYMPSSEGNGVPADVVISANLETSNPSITDDHTIHVRNLPAKFVIATKVGATWYALPANMTGETNPLAEVIEVDETTMTATAPNTSTYTLWPVKTTNGTGNRYAEYGDRVRFAAVNYEQRGLWANNNNSSSAIRNYAVINSLGADVLAAYEWKLTTTVVDGHWQYTLQTDQTQNQNYLRYWTSAEGTPVGPKWGTYNAGENKLYFLPITETQPFEYAVVEWYPTKVLIQTDAAITSPTVKVDGEAVANPILTHKGGKLYEISNLPLETNPNKLLQISFTDNAINYINTKVVPIILSRGAKTITGEPFATLTQKVYQYADVVVRDGATLSIDGTTDVANTLLGVTIYPTAKVSVAEGKKLSVHSLTFFGGIDEIYDGSTYKINKYGVPQLSLKGILSKTVTTIDYIMRVDLDQMYSLTVPYDVQLADIKYWDGSNIELGSALYVSAYDGEARANQSKKTWIYETDFESRLGAATLKAGVGYTISAELQAGVGDEYSILRMPMISNVASGATETAKTVAVTAHGIDANITDNHKGWNLVGNPYMTTIEGADDADLVLGYLKETGTGPWEWVDDGIRYVTIPSDDGTYYWQQKFTTAELPPFKNFFVQIGTTGELQFGLGTRQSMPARSTQAAIEKEVEFEILMSNDARQDNTGLLISEEYSPAYEINADLEKMIGSMSVYTIYGWYKLAYNALSPINASEWIPMGYVAPAAGEYTFRLDDIDKIVEQVEHVYLIDYEANNIVDLMDDEYEFTTDKEQNNNRFAINIVLIQDKDNTTTGLDIINGNNTAPIKFIYHDKIYIKSGEVIYDGTGKQVTNINK